MVTNKVIEIIALVNSVSIFLFILVRKIRTSFEIIICINLTWQFLFLKNLFILFIYFWLRLGLFCCAWAFSSCGERGLLFIAVHGLRIAVASLVAEHGL